MRILFTGASSFTGYWFVKSLAEMGHEVIAVFRQKEEHYSGLRKRRVGELKDISEGVFECEFGSSAFLDVIAKSSHFDLFCHHAAEVHNYRSYEFDFLKALERNTKNLQTVLQKLQQKGCHKILLTGTIFEQNEGAGSHLGAVYPYALSKGLTYEVFRYYAEKLALRLGKFIVANPFGPLEEPKFTAYLMRSWMKKEVPKVQTPAYIRDNIHVDLLAKAYARYASSLESLPIIDCFRPSGYVETQGAFAKRLSDEMASRLNLPCQFESLEQKEFPEPYARYNTDPLSAEEYEWDEKQAWDQMAKFYLESAYDMSCV